MTLRNVRTEVGILERYMPIGRIFDALRTSETNANSLLVGLASEFMRGKIEIDTFRREILPDQTIAFLSEWESALGLPDECFQITDSTSDDTRRQYILIKLASLGIQSADDFVYLASLFGITVRVNSGIAHMPTGEGGYETALPTLVATFGTVKEARNTIVVVVVLPAEEFFEYSYPIPFTSTDRATLQCLFTKLKPAFCAIRFEEESP